MRKDEEAQVICKNCADLADDPSIMNHDKGDCDQEGCTCQHRDPGTWNHTPLTSRAALPSMSISQARALLTQTLSAARQSQCSVCMRHLAVTPKSKRIVRHKRDMLCEKTMSDGTVRRAIVHYRCEGSGKAPLPVKATVPTATSLLALTDEG